MANLTENNIEHTELQCEQRARKREGRKITYTILVDNIDNHNKLPIVGTVNKSYTSNIYISYGCNIYGRDTSGIVFELLPSN